MLINGQDSEFSDYGGIEDTEKYIEANYGLGWLESRSAVISGVDCFLQSELEHNSDNCTLASITRIMKYYSDSGFTNIPSDIYKIYKMTRGVGVAHGYDPRKSSILRDLFVYTPWEIDNIVQDTWKVFGYPDGNASNNYFGKLAIMKKDIDNLNPLMLNIAFGDYKDHTVSVTGYKIFSKKGKKDIPLVQIYDGWSENVRYIDWKKFGLTPSNVTRFSTPDKSN